jgi:molecular chaperone HtpG
MNTQKHAFQAEVSQLLHLVTHSLYSNKEIFLRELISNATDACDKLRFEALANSSLYGDQTNLEIRITLDEEARTLTVTDTGIGMSSDEAVEHLGTIAKSGTREFMNKLSGDQKADSQLIGQFGVGFYSGFIVADNIVVESRRAGLSAEEGVRWSSKGAGDFEVETITRAQRGTSVTLHLREDAKDFVQSWKVRELISKYSDHIALPIKMESQKWEDSKEEGQPGKMIKTGEWETVNKATALWTRPKKDIADDQYIQFYEQTTHDWKPPLAWTHNKVEGNTEYTQLLYIPSHAPHDLWEREQKTGVKLYVRRVFIMDDVQQLLPRYLRFVKGVIDSADLPLNVSRELLQESRDTTAIREGNTRRILGLLEDMAKSQEKLAPAKEPELPSDPLENPDVTDVVDVSKKDDVTDVVDVSEKKSDSAETQSLATETDSDLPQPTAPGTKYASFWHEFGAVLKEGLGEDQSNRERIAKLLRFYSTTSDIPGVSFDLYKSRMKIGQKAIYYITADTLPGARHSPQLEIFRKKGIEVLLMADRVDEWAITFLREYDGTPLQSVAKGAVDRGDLQDEAEKEAAQVAADTVKPLVEKLKTVLKNQVDDVRVTTRLVDSPACLVVKDGDVSNQMARLLKQIGQSVPDTKPVLEINPEHPLVKKLENSPDFDSLAQILHDQALLAEGVLPEDPASYVRRINALLA